MFTWLKSLHTVLLILPILKIYSLARFILYLVCQTSAKATIGIFGFGAKLDFQVKRLTETLMGLEYDKSRECSSLMALSGAKHAHGMIER